jgi:hypothetical protein
MDTISSAAFRKSYAKLTDPTVVTVNGHALGTWIPQGHESATFQVTINERSEGPQPAVVVTPDRFNTVPFTPVPKSRK